MRGWRSLEPDGPAVPPSPDRSVWTYRWIGGREHARCCATARTATTTTPAPPRRSNSATGTRTCPTRPCCCARRANDPNGIVRMEAAIAASYIGTNEALEAMLDVLKHPRGGHLDYAIRSALGSRDTQAAAGRRTRSTASRPCSRSSRRRDDFKEPTPTAAEAQFDAQKDLYRCADRRASPSGCCSPSISSRSRRASR